MYIVVRLLELLDSLLVIVSFEFPHLVVDIVGDEEMGLGFHPVADAVCCVVVVSGADHG
jgi:hypothetical protein